MYSPECSEKIGSIHGTLYDEVKCSRAKLETLISDTVLTGKSILQNRAKFGINSDRESELITDLFLAIAEKKAASAQREALVCSAKSWLGKCTAVAVLKEVSQYT